jgi:hypothetical protein
MKKVLYISLFLFGLVAASCTKQEIVPNSLEVQEAPTWGFDASVDDDSDYDRGSESGEDDEISTGGSDGGDIVDPENDEDGESTKN